MPEKSPQEWSRLWQWWPSFSVNFYDSTHQHGISFSIIMKCTLKKEFQEQFYTCTIVCTICRCWIYIPVGTVATLGKGWEGLCPLPKAFRELALLVPMVTCGKQLCLFLFFFFFYFSFAFISHSFFSWVCVCLFCLLALSSSYRDSSEKKEKLPERKKINKKI